ncbi:MAG: PDZ domain-containing protein [Armatimonadota bacterium]
MKNKVRIILFFMAVLLFLLPCAYSQEQVEYIIDMPQPASHFFEVTVKFKAPDNGYTQVLFPVNVPGHYTDENFVKDLQEFSAFDGDNKPLKFERTGLNQWKVYHPENSSVNIKYRVYANNQDIHYSYLNSQRVLINPASLCMYIKDKTDVPCRMTVNFPGYWRVATSLKKTEDGAYYAPSYDVLADSPVMAGFFKTDKIIYKDVVYNIILDSVIRLDLGKFTPDLEKIIKQEVDMMGGVPFKEYYFFILGYPDRRVNGATEHTSSSIIGFSTENINYIDEKLMKSLLGVCAHEFFHLWNDKCIHAANIYPYDYNDTNLTRLYWFFEGFTQYYGDLFTEMAGIIDRKEYFNKLENNIDYLKNVASAKIISAQEASFAGNYLEPQNKDENILNFYSKGAVIALLADMEIRHKTGNKKSLDDVMRYLYLNYGLKNISIKESDLESIFQQASGVDLKDIFNNYIKGTEDIDYNKYLNYAGLELKEKKGEAEVFAGIKGDYSYKGLRVKKVEKDSPADKACIYIDDLIVAVNGIKIPDADFLNGRKKDDKISIQLFRDNILEEVQLVLESKEPESYTITEIENPNVLQKKILKSWLD